MFRKKMLLSLLLAFFISNFYAVTIQLIDQNKISGIEDLQTDLSYLENNETMFSYYIPDDYWNFTKSKTELAKTLKVSATKLEKLTPSTEEGKQELYLLRGLVYFYLFNLDEQAYFEKAITELNKIQKLSEPDYRYKWFLGKIYAHASKPFLAITNYQFIELSIPEAMIHPEFWEDYGEAAVFAHMPKKALYCYEQCAKTANFDVANLAVYTDLKSKIKTTTINSAINKASLYQLFNRQSGYGYLSEALGVWLPLQADWQIKMYDYENQASGIAFKSGNLETKKYNNITYTIGCFFNVNQEDVTKNLMNTAPQMQQVYDLAINKAYTVYEMKDPNRYQNIGGAHGYLVIYETDAKNRPTNSIEAPAMYPDNSDNTEVYTPLDTIYTRIPGTISYVFMLDSCEDIFETSKTDFVNFINGLIIE